MLVVRAGLQAVKKVKGGHPGKPTPPPSLPSNLHLSPPDLSLGVDINKASSLLVCVANNKYFTNIKGTD